MAVTLAKGEKVSLNKAAPGLTRIEVGLGWQERETDGPSFDLDASAFILGTSGKVRSDSDFIFYNNLKSVDSAVEHTGDVLEGGTGADDDETLKVDLAAVPAEVDKIAFTVTIHEAEQRSQNFGMVRNAYIRIVDASDGSEVVRYDLSEDFSTETALVFGELYRHSGEWRFSAVGQGYAGGLGALASQYGVNV